jgi:hypothetical protein
MSEPPPDYTGMNLDFSEFHPLDHSLWRCAGFPGGRRRHLSYRWQFQWGAEVRQRTLCVLRMHAWVRGWRRTDGEWTQLPAACLSCGRMRDE